jgi:hypothetical protein
MKSLPMGYKLRPDGLYEKQCEFMSGRKNNTVQATAIIVRTKNGALIRTIESRGTTAKIKQHSKL